MQRRAAGTKHVSLGLVRNLFLGATLICGVQANAQTHPSFDHLLNIEFSPAPITVGQLEEMLAASEIDVGAFTSTIFGLADPRFCPPRIEIRLLYAALSEQDEIENPHLALELMRQQRAGIGFELEKIGLVMDAYFEEFTEGCDENVAEIGQIMREAGQRFEDAYSSASD